MSIYFQPYVKVFNRSLVLMKSMSAYKQTWQSIKRFNHIKGITTVWSEKETQDLFRNSSAKERQGHLRNFRIFWWLDDPAKNSLYYNPHGANMLSQFSSSFSEISRLIHGNWFLFSSSPLSVPKSKEHFLLFEIALKWHVININFAYPKHRTFFSPFHVLIWEFTWRTALTQVERFPVKVIKKDEVS